MKKLLTVLALALMSVVMAVTVAGCGTDSELADKVDELTERIEALEKENDNLKTQYKNLNVFWTDKKEYSATETMTIYFGRTAVYRIRIQEFKWGSSSREYIYGTIYLTSFCADILEDSIATSTYLSCDGGTYICPPSNNSTPPVIKQNVEKNTRRRYDGDGATNDTTKFDFVICMPGTPFELARFKNVTVNK